MLLTAEELAARLKKHPRTIMRQARQRRIPGSKIGRDWYFDLAEVLAHGRPVVKARKVVRLSPQDRAAMDGQRTRVKQLMGRAG